MKELLERIQRILNEIPNQDTRFGSTYELASEIGETIKNQEIKFVAVYGDNLIKSIAENEKVNLNETGGCFIEKSFLTQAEFDAYIQALDDHEGWFGSYILNDGEKEKYSEII